MPARKTELDSSEPMRDRVTHKEMLYTPITEYFYRVVNAAAKRLDLPARFGCQKGEVATLKIAKVVPVLASIACLQVVLQHDVVIQCHRPHQNVLTWPTSRCSSRPRIAAGTRACYERLRSAAFWVVLHMKRVAATLPQCSGKVRQSYRAICIGNLHWEFVVMCRCPPRCRLTAC